MKNLITTIIFILLFPLSVSAQGSESEWWKDNQVYSLSHPQKWDKWDKRLFGTFLISSTMDCLQTYYIFDNHDEYNERNPIVSHYGENSIIPYFIVTRVGCYLIADHLKPKPRKIFLGIITSISFKAVADNKHVGIKIRF